MTNRIIAIPSKAEVKELLEIAMNDKIVRMWFAGFDFNKVFYYFCIKFCHNLNERCTMMI